MRQRHRSARLIPAIALTAAMIMGALAPPADAEETHNLAADAPYTVTVGVPDATDAEAQEETYPDPGGALTDGTSAGDEFTDPGWVGYLRQSSRTITLDLGGLQTIESLSTDFLFYPSAAVYLPATVRYSLSTNGTTWRTAGRVDGDNVGIETGHRSVGLSIDPTLARFVRVTFDVNGWGFADEITVQGKDGRTSGARPPTGPKDDPDGETCSPDATYLPQGTPEVGGVENAFLAYTYDTKSENGEVGTWRPESLLPVITHTDDDNVPTDWMFDTVLFMAGGSELDGYQDEAAWTDLLDRLFVPGQNVPALNTATADAAGQLGDADHRTKLMLPIPNPVADSDQPWGSIDGRELDLNPERVGEETSAANRLTVVNWFIDETMKRLEATDAEHLDLVGFYWMREAIAPNSSDSRLSVKVSERIHGLDGDLKFYWIPYFQAAGYQHWRSYGFDGSMLQPNYFFNDDLPAGDNSRLDKTTELARCTGQGVEIEGDEAMIDTEDGRTKFQQYLDVFAETGADQALKGYYWGSRKTFEAVVHHDDPEVRAPYDAAYRFIRDSR